MYKILAGTICLLIVFNGVNCSQVYESQIIIKPSDDKLQEVTCYDGKGQTGESLNLVTGYIADLSWGYNFDNKISSCCFQGIWILYEDYAYNIDHHDVRNGFIDELFTINDLFFDDLFNKFRY